MKNVLAWLITDTAKTNALIKGNEILIIRYMRGDEDEAVCFAGYVK